MKTLLSLITALFFLTDFCLAGVIVTKQNTSEIGTLLDSGEKIRLSMIDGAVNFYKNDLLWYNADRTVTSYFIAAEKAKQEGQSIAVLTSLLQKSIDLEPSTKSEAKIRLAKIKSKLAKKIEDAATKAKAEETAAHASEVDPLLVQSEFSRLSSKTVASTIHYQSTEFQGFINYESSAVISSGAGNTKQFTFKIPQPVFSNTSLDTTVISYGR